MHPHRWLAVGHSSQYPAAMYRPARRRWLPLVLLAVIVVAPAAVLATIQSLPVDGDEPHYLIHCSQRTA